MRTFTRYLYHDGSKIFLNYSRWWDEISMDMHESWALQQGLARIPHPLTDTASIDGSLVQVESKMLSILRRDQGVCLNCDYLAHSNSSMGIVPVGRTVQASCYIS